MGWFWARGASRLAGVVGLVFVVLMVAIGGHLPGDGTLRRPTERVETTD